jgi:hypothetical protein
MLAGMPRIRTLLAAGSVVGVLLFRSPTSAAEPPEWSTGKIMEAKASEMTHPVAAAFLNTLAAYARNKTDAIQMESVYDIMEQGYGRCAATVPVNGSADKVYLQFFPHGNRHDGPERFHESEFIEFRDGSHWTHVDLKEGFPGFPKGTPKTAIISKEQNALGSDYLMFSGLDLLPHVMRLWKHKISMLSYLQGSTQSFFELATMTRGGHVYLVFRTGGTPEEVIMEPDKGFALVEHTYVNSGLSTKVLEQQEIKPGIWIPKKAEHIFPPINDKPTVIKQEIVDFKIVPMKELEEKLFYHFSPGWRITDERIGKVFTIGEPPGGTPHQEQ